MVAKIDRTGEVNINTQGLKMKIVKYRNANNIDVEFISDGYVKKRVRYEHFKKGNVKNDNLENRLDEINYNKFGSKIIIKEYRNSLDVDIYFPEYDWIAKNNQYDNFKRGVVRCPYEPRSFNKGYLGEGKYDIYGENTRHNKCYNTWKSMLERCYDEKFQIKQPTYMGCKVCKEWLNFQNFADWYYKNYYKIDNEKMCLDKDILVKGNKIYSPETCVFVPHNINILFIERDKCRGSFPIGVSYHKQHNKYSSNCHVYNFDTSKSKLKHLGYYETPEEAFKVYKEFKESYIKQVADYYKNKIPTKLYDALYNYQVEITD